MFREKRKLVQAQIVLPMTHASGNQLEHNTRTNTVYRTGNYKEYQNYVASTLEELADEVGWSVPKGIPLGVKLMFTYKVPQSLIDTKKKYQLFSDGQLYPITRGTKDLDNSAKCVGDALQMAFDFDDSQFVLSQLAKNYGEQNELYVEINEVENVRI